MTLTLVDLLKFETIASMNGSLGPEAVMGFGRRELGSRISGGPSNGGGDMVCLEVILRNRLKNICEYFWY